MKRLIRLNIQETGCKESIITPDFLKTGEKTGITGEIRAPYEKIFDSYPMEELFNDQAWRI